MFKFIANHIDLREMSNDSANELVRHINCVLDNEKEREQIKYSPLFLCVLRRQNYAITEEMDKKIAEYLPSYYGDTYRLEITENENEDIPETEGAGADGITKLDADEIQDTNERQDADERQDTDLDLEDREYITEGTGSYTDEKGEPCEVRIRLKLEPVEEKAYVDTWTKISGFSMHLEGEVPLQDTP